MRDFDPRAKCIGQDKWGREQEGGREPDQERERGREKAKRINKKDAELVKLMYPVDKKDLLSA